MAARPRLFALSALMLTSCLDAADRELTVCHPNCRLDAGEMDALAPADTGADGDRDGGADPEERTDAGDPELAPLQATEVTAHQITWRWSTDDVPSNVVSYRLRYATNGDLIGTADPWDDRSDANLGYRTSPLGPGIVDRTRVLLLIPGTTYYARLYGVVEGGVEVPLAQGMATTRAVPAAALQLFDEELGGAVLAGFQDPSTAARAYQGVGALWFESNASLAAELRSLNRAIPQGLTDGWGGAYLELVIFVSPSRKVPFVRISITGFAGEAALEYDYFALPARAEWQQLEVPLTAFADHSEGASVEAFGVEARSWGDAATVFVDAVSIRY